MALSEEKIDRIMDNIDKKMDKIDHRMDLFSNKFDQCMEKIEKNNSKIEILSSIVMTNIKKTEENYLTIKDLMKDFDELEDDVRDLRNEIKLEKEHKDKILKFAKWATTAILSGIGGILFFTIETWIKYFRN